MKENILKELKKYIDTFDNEKVFYPENDKEKEIIFNMFNVLFCEFNKLETDSQTKDQTIKTFINKTLEDN
jgi:hypothetical protein